MEQTIQKLKDLARESWSGATGEERAVRLEEFVRDMLASYSLKLDISQPDLLSAFEKRRSYSAINYYQLANFPDLSQVTLLKNTDELKQRYPSGRFICPFCGGESTDPYECNTGLKVGKGKQGQVCDWKAYGLFGTAGKGLRVAVLEGFLDNPNVHEIFMPVEHEKYAQADERSQRKQGVAT